ncbi:MAG: desulfoferrodoxin [Oscillospiraceae bacterium]|jgi:superoxide reductase|nr:desulfoferrodoxin [Oscillospiraceae bacterium]
MKFYRCSHCGNIIAYVENSGVPVFCCGQKMEEILPNTTDAANEKHVPVVNVEGNKVTVNVGTAPHPMTDAHYIGWVVLCTNLGNQRKLLSPDSEPKAEFLLLENESVEACYAYCNLHGLWKA